VRHPGQWAGRPDRGARVSGTRTARSGRGPGRRARERPSSGPLRDGELLAVLDEDQPGGRGDGARAVHRLRLYDTTASDLEGGAGLEVVQRPRVDLDPVAPLGPGLEGGDTLCGAVDGRRRIVGVH